MRVLFATAEFAPLARVGGLAAAAAGYVAEIRRSNIDVQVVMPDYSGSVLSNQSVTNLAVPDWAGPAVARTGTPTGELAAMGEITLVDLPGIRRSHPYLQPNGEGWWDNDRRFFAFSTAVAAIAHSSRPDVLHLNDWHTATTLAHLADPPPTVLTIHTLAYQGQEDPKWVNAFPFNQEQFLYGGACNPLAGAIRCADLVVAVSPNYARAITTDDGGFGLAPLLRNKGERLVGILNGIDLDEWNPATDAHLPVRYDITDLSPKAEIRARLLDGAGLTQGRGPLLVVVSRLVHQKGIDSVVPIVPYLRGLGARLIVLGSGEQSLVDSVESCVRHHPDVISFVNGYDEGLAHRLFAGGDVLVMPSRFEPCGLAQMQAMRYGTLPLVTDVGGLHDTVVDIDSFPLSGTGVVVPESSPIALLDGVHRMTRAFSQNRRKAAMRSRGMKIDWSWEEPAARHLQWYHCLLDEAAAEAAGTHNLNC